MIDHQKGLREEVARRLNFLLTLPDGCNLPGREGVCAEISHALLVYRTYHASLSSSGPLASSELRDMSAALENHLGDIISEYLNEHNMFLYCCVHSIEAHRMNPHRRELIGRLLAYLEKSA